MGTHNLTEVKTGNATNQTITRAPIARAKATMPPNPRLYTPPIHC